MVAFFVVGLTFTAADMPALGAGLAFPAMFATWWFMGKQRDAVFSADQSVHTLAPATRTPIAG